MTKAKNHDIVRKAILKFCGYMIASVAMAVCFFFCFMKTSATEIFKIMDKSEEYDQIRANQLNLTEKVDTLYYYASLINYDSRINYKSMQTALSSKKIQFSNTLLPMSEKDCRIYKRLAGQMNIFLDTKDSLVITISELDLIRNDLQRCISDNKKVTRTISTGGLTFGK